MERPYQPAPDVHVLPTSVPLPGAGVLPVNAYVLVAEQPVLIDTGMAMDSPQFVEALSSIVAPSDLRWIWLTHDDADHTGSIREVVRLAPQATLVTQAFSAFRMASWWDVPLERVHAVGPGDVLDVGDRELLATRPPLFDNPMSTGLLDRKTGALFTVDAFGAVVPEPTEDAAEIPEDALAGGMAGWASADAPWAHMLDRERFAKALHEVRSLSPSAIYSSHLPAAKGSMLERFLEVIASVPDAEPFSPPDSVMFQAMVAEIVAAHANAVTAATGGPPPSEGGGTGAAVS